MREYVYLKKQELENRKTQLINLKAELQQLVKEARNELKKAKAFRIEFGNVEDSKKAHSKIDEERFQKVVDYYINEIDAIDKEIEEISSKLEVY